jgi:hypothetical protein
MFGDAGVEGRWVSSGRGGTDKLLTPVPALHEAPCPFADRNPQTGHTSIIMIAVDRVAVQTQFFIPRSYCT